MRTTLFKALACLPLLGLAGVTAGLSLAPALSIYSRMIASMALWSPAAQHLGGALALVVGYFVYGFALILITFLIFLI